MYYLVLSYIEPAPPPIEMSKIEMSKIIPHLQTLRTQIDQLKQAQKVQEQLIARVQSSAPVVDSTFSAKKIPEASDIIQENLQLANKITKDLVLARVLSEQSTLHESILPIVYYFSFFLVLVLGGVTVLITWSIRKFGLQAEKLIERERVATHKMKIDTMIMEWTVDVKIDIGQKNMIGLKKQLKD